MASKPKVTVVTLNWNGWEDTKNCLDSLKKITYENHEVVIVDNGSKNQEADRIAAEFPYVHLIRNKKNLGFTGGCNQGISYALKTKADYVLLLNNDTEVTPDFLSQMVHFYEMTPDAGMVSPRILYSDREHIWFDGAKLIYALGFTRNIHKGRLASETPPASQPFRTGFGSGCALLVSASLVKKIGLMDERYFAYYEDLDWCYKATKHKRYSYVVPDALIYHKKSASTGAGGKSKFGPTAAYYLARNAVLFATNLSGLTKAIYLLAQFYSKLPLSLLLLVRPSAWKNYLAGLFKGFYLLARGES